MDLIVNISFRKMHGWHDSEKRAEHVFERMRLRGIGVTQIKEAIRKGAKHLRKDGTIVCAFRWFAVIYREFPLDENTKKIYPITVMEA